MSVSVETLKWHHPELPERNERQEALFTVWQEVSRKDLLIWILQIISDDNHLLYKYHILPKQYTPWRIHTTAVEWDISGCTN